MTVATQITEIKSTLARLESGGVVLTFPSFDRLALIQHVSMIHARAALVPGDGFLVLGMHGEDPATGAKIRSIERGFKVGDIAGMIDAIDAHKDDDHRNVWIAPAVFHTDSRKKENVKAALALVADFDDANAANWASRLPLPPDYVLETSEGRFQCFYMLAGPATPADWQPIADRLHAATGCDHCTKDVSHIWRVPGTGNKPNGKKVREGRSADPQPVIVSLPWTGNTTSLADLDRALPALPALPTTAGTAEPDEGGSAIDVASILKVCRPQIRALIVEGTCGDRSAALFKVIKALIKMHLCDADIAAVIQAHPKGIGEKYAGRGDLMIEIARIRGKPEVSPDLRCRDGGTPIADLANMLILMRRPAWDGVLNFNELSSRVEVHRLPPWGDAGLQVIGRGVAWGWTDTADFQAAEWAQKQGVGVTPSTVAQAVQVIAEQNKFNPLIEYLDCLAWDGVPRLDKWAVGHLGAEDTPYVRAVSGKWMISAAARAYEPGCKADCALILEGEQGIRKSSALAVLGGEFFSDQIQNIGGGDKDTIEGLQGFWIIEIPELIGMGKAETSAIKRFLSVAVDRFRPSYGRRTQSFPRQFVFAGSTNDAEYLRDATGGRRWWPVAVGKIDIAGLRVARDQLWAEAVARFKAGEQWWLTEEMGALAEAEQRARYVSDDWDGPVMGYASDRASVSTAEIGRAVLGCDLKQWSKADQMRVAAILTSRGWKSRLEGKDRLRRFINPTPPTPTAALALTGDPVIDGAISHAAERPL